MKGTPELVAECLTRAGVRAFFVGGLALEAHGYGRQTYDVDCLLAAPERGAFEEALLAAGYSRASGGENFSRYMPATVYQSPVDVLLVDSETFATMWQEGQPWEEGREQLRVPSLLHLIALKLHAMRNNPAREPRDMADIVALLAANPGAVEDRELDATCEKYGPPGIRSRLPKLRP